MVEDSAQRVYVAGTDWRIIGTYNSEDLGRVFSMGAALSRRWATIPVPPLEADEIMNPLGRIAGLPVNLLTLIQQLYAAHLGVLPLGPAPFLDMARYVADENSAPPPAGAAPNSISQVALAHLRDAYVLHLSPQLRRLDPERRAQLIEAVAGIMGRDLGDELGRY